MGGEPGDPRGAGLPPAGQERCHSLFAAPLGLGGPSGSLRSRQGLCLSASLSHPAQQSCSSVLGPPACHLPRGPGPGGRVWGEGPRSWRPEEAPGLTSPWQSLGTVSSAGNSGSWCAARAAENCVGSRRQRRGPSAQALDSGSRRAELPAGLGLRFHPAARLRAAGPPCERPG